ncbi:hypothetical protein EDB92DRAFT_2053149 [Lactarius akahatsu]|uniref:J domain-containing protein n=1 Tax=Lactarius akahatsu TaxID=416441 RepID=A0AAD4QEX8_9AGAM|nr:hypothetical protein EDB92DRAFT_2053149 [Lactarius akahatsu]
MPKRLRLKRTPAEQAEHDLRKARRATKKATSKQRGVRGTDLDSASKHSGGLDAEFDFTSPDPGPSTSHYGAGATAEDERFQQNAARLNEYAHVPRRWRGVGPREYNLDSTGGQDDDPRFMNDDEYAEWVRVGIWWKRNAEAYRQEQHRKAAQAAAWIEAARVLKAEDDARRRKREDRERKRQMDARDTYDRRWVELLNSKSVDLGFGDVPWPVRGKVEIAQLTTEAISAFLFPSGSGVERGRTRKEVLREAMLRFHPDKFEGRDRDPVREGANAVARAVMGLITLDSGIVPP